MDNMGPLNSRSQYCFYYLELGRELTKKKKKWKIILEKEILLCNFYARIQ